MKGPTFLKGNISAKTKEATESIGKAAENIGNTQAVKSAMSAASTIKEELEVETLGGMVYRPPKVLRKRKQDAEGESTHIEADEETTGVELHKDSRFAQSWANFKENNPMMNKFSEARYIVILRAIFIVDQISISFHTWS